mgnify:CR=1 FL=1
MWLLSRECNFFSINLFFFGGGGDAVLQKRLFVCVVINPCVLSANRANFGLFCLICSQELALTEEQLCMLTQGNITNWSDPRLANSSTSPLPDLGRRGICGLVVVVVVVVVNCCSRRRRGETKDISMKNIGVKVLIMNRIIWGGGELDFWSSTLSLPDFGGCLLNFITVLLLFSL